MNQAGFGTALSRFAHAVRADYASLQRYRGKYHHEKVPTTRLPLDAVRKIGFQMLIATRVMRLCKDSGVPGAKQVASRMIRHLYGAEIHWDTEIAPGVSIVHGTGLVLSHRARVGPGCILFHNVTLGEGLDADTKESGAPTLERDVHIGPGATLIGPITIGQGSKIMAGAVVTKSVPAGSIVKPAESIVTARERPAVAVKNA
jgi:serine acetyltransferase